MDTLGTRRNRLHRGSPFPWVPVVLCGLLLLGVLFYETLRVRQLQTSLEEAMQKVASLNAIQASATEREAKLAEGMEQAVAQLKFVQQSAEQLAELNKQASVPVTPAEDPRRVELEKLVLFLRDELAAANNTIELFKEKERIRELGKSVETSAAASNKTGKKGDKGDKASNKPPVPLATQPPPAMTEPASIPKAKPAGAMP